MPTSFSPSSSSVFPKCLLPSFHILRFKRAPQLRPSHTRVRERSHIYSLQRKTRSKIFRFFINLPMAKQSQMLNAFVKLSLQNCHQQEWRVGIRHDQPDVWRRCLKYFLEDNWHDNTRCRKCVQQITFNIIRCGDIWGFERRQNVAFRGRVKSLLTNHQKYSHWKQCDKANR